MQLVVDEAYCEYAEHDPGFPYGLEAMLSFIEHHRG
jgi:hypothetical protein